VLLPPNVPQKRVETLRAAFMDTMKDPEFIAQAKKLNLDLDPMSGTDMQSLIASTFDVTPELLSKARTLYNA
jgi:tripartite-type tricarboxylate transporter receptor subunit TctC